MVNPVFFNRNSLKFEKDEATVINNQVYSVTNRRNILILADAIPGITGGSLRSARSIVEYSKLYNVYLIIPHALDTLEEKLDELMRILNVEEILDFSVRGGFIKPLHERFSALFT